jgi:hypothetical protein
LIKKEKNVASGAFLRLSKCFDFQFTASTSTASTLISQCISFSSKKKEKKKKKRLFNTVDKQKPMDRGEEEEEEY